MLFFKKTKKNGGKFLTYKAGKSNSNIHSLVT